MSIPGNDVIKQRPALHESVNAVTQRSLSSILNLQLSLPL